jgi:hypothetical protein
MGLKALEEPNRLWDWMRAKGHKNLVLRIGDVLQLPNALMAAVDRIVRELNIGLVSECAHDLDAASRIKYACPGGYLVVSIDRLARQPWIDMPFLIDLQSAILHYREIRRGLGYPSRKEECKCGKRRSCRQCGGKGYTSTIVEMSDHEVLLAYDR